MSIGLNYHAEIVDRLRELDQRIRDLDELGYKVVSVEKSSTTVGYEVTETISIRWNRPEFTLDMRSKA